MTTQKPFLRRHTIGASIAGTALALGLVAGGVGVSGALADTPATPSASSTPAAPATPGTAHPHAKHHRIHGVRGTITKIDGDTWTVHTKAGATVTVKISSTTAFGTTKSSATRASFVVGDRIAAIGKRHDHVVTAKRIVHLHAAAHTATPKPTPGTGS